MKRVMVAIAALGLMTSSGYGGYTFDWSFTANMNSLGYGTFSPGWLVQLYQDVGANSVLGSITSFTSAGAPVGGTGTDTDTLLGSYTTSLLSGKTGNITWLSGGRSYATMTGASIYSVVFNSSTRESASQALVIDASPYVLPSFDSDFVPYTQNTIAGSGPGNTWVAVPEPSTLALMGLGTIIIGVRRALRKA